MSLINNLLTVSVTHATFLIIFTSIIIIIQNTLNTWIFDIEYTYTHVHYIYTYILCWNFKYYAGGQSNKNVQT